MTELHDLPVRDRWARLRFAVVGPLLAAPPEPGQLRELITALAAKRWRHPVTGDDVQFGRSTVERWFYRARKAAQDPVASLRDRKRPCGAGASLSPQAVQAIRAQYRESRLDVPTALRQPQGHARPGEPAVVHDVTSLSARARPLS